jgi:hypothetical protein
MKIEYYKRCLKTIEQYEKREKDVFIKSGLESLRETLQNKINELTTTPKA